MRYNVINRLEKKSKKKNEILGSDSLSGKCRWIDDKGGICSGWDYNVKLGERTLNFQMPCVSEKSIVGNVRRGFVWGKSPF